MNQPIRLGAIDSLPQEMTPAELEVFVTGLRRFFADALAYYGRRQKWSDEQREAFEADCAVLCLTDESLLGVLRQTGADEAYTAYIGADEALQEGLLFANTFVKNGEVQLRNLLETQQKQAHSGQATALFASKVDLLHRLHCLLSDTDDQPTPDAPTNLGIPDMLALTAYYAWRKHHYLGQLAAALALGTKPVKTIGMAKRLITKSDLLLATVPPSPAPPLRLGAPLTPNQEYDAHKKNLQETVKKLETAARQFKPDQNDPAAVRNFRKQYTQLTRERDQQAFLVKAKSAEITTLKSWTEGGKDFVSANLNDKLGALKAGGLAVLAATGPALMDMAKRVAKGEKVNVEEELATVVQSVLILAGVGVATAFLGPLGTAIAGGVVSSLYQKPDAGLMKLKEIDEKMDALHKNVEKGFFQTAVQINKLNDNITAGFKNLVVKVEDIQQADRELKPLQEAVASFVEEGEKIIKLFNEVESMYAQQLYSMRPTVDESRLLELDGNITDALTNMTRRLVNRSFALFDKPKVPFAAEPLAQQLISLYQSKRTFQPFHIACDELNQLCEQVHRLLVHYLRLRPQIQEMLAATAVFMNVSTEYNKEALLKQALSMSAQEAGRSASIFAALVSLRPLAMGSRNMHLYQTLSYLKQDRSSVASFNLTAGFGLLPNEQPGRQYAPDPRTGWFQTEELRTTTDPHGKQHQPLARYYVAPLSALQLANCKTDYHLFTFWQRELSPLRLDVRMALAPEDKVCFYDTDFAKPLTAQVVPLTDPAFDGAVERLLLPGQGGTPLPPVGTTAMWQLPSGRGWLKLSPTQKHGRAYWRASLLDEEGKYIRFLMDFWAEEIELDPASSLPNLEKFAARLLDDEGFRPNLNRSYNGGMWTNRQALAQERPVGLGEATTEQLPFTHVLQAGDTLHALVSPNGRYWLKAEQRRDGLMVLSYYEDGKCVGSVFDRYDYKGQNRQVYAKFQADGNLVLLANTADGKEYCVAATHTYGCSYSQLTLGDDGRIRLLDAKGEEKKTLEIFSLLLRDENVTNFWASPFVADQNAELHSLNGLYRVSLRHYWGGEEEYFEVTDEILLIFKRSHAFIKRAIGLQLARTYRDSEQRPWQNKGEWQASRHFLTQVSNYSSKELAPLSWEMHSKDDDIGTYIEERKLNSSERRVRLDFHAGGKVEARVVSKQVPTVGSDAYGVGTICELVSKERADGDVYLDLADDGALRLRRRNDHTVLMTLLEPC